MKTKEIKALPKEFNFKSNINPFNILYHAKEEKHCYKVTCLDDLNGSWLINKKDFHRHLLDNNFEICV